MNRVCVIKGCFKKHDSSGFCSKHHYLFIDKQRIESKPKVVKLKQNIFQLKEEYKPVKFKVDEGEYSLLTQDKKFD